jgi:hypothetical protein
MSGDIGIGKLIDQERHRDAIHIAVAPIEAAHELRPGERIGIHEGKAFGAAVGLITAIGIVDPFLTHVILPGQKFYMFLFPGSISSLRHEWEHPAFVGVKPMSAPPPSDRVESEKWLREYAKMVNPHHAEGGYYWKKTGEDRSYQILMDDLAGNSITYHGLDMHSRGELVNEKELQHHASIVLGRPVNFDNFEYFSCSC